jgi:metallo-beta-lactamase family protein
MESTYGDRLHETYDDARHQLRDLVNRTARRRGKLIIPAFAVGRTQELVYALNQLDATGDIPAIRVFVDSPLAVNATDDASGCTLKPGTPRSSIFWKKVTGAAPSTIP